MATTYVPYRTGLVENHNTEMMADRETWGKAKQITRHILWDMAEGVRFITYGEYCAIMHENIPEFSAKPWHNQNMSRLLSEQAVDGRLDLGLFLDSLVVEKLSGFPSAGFDAMHRTNGWYDGKDIVKYTQGAQLKCFMRVRELNTSIALKQVA